MKIFLSVIICRFLSFLGRLLKRGSSMPGLIVLKLFPDILRRLDYPELVIAVSGSNGKTSTVEMLADALTANGKKVIYNREGSNQTEGICTLLLNNCTLRGKIKADAVVLESDERYARLTFRHFSPSHFVVTNLFRDQMTRNGHPEWIFDLLGKGISSAKKLILNGDDPLVSAYGRGRNDVTYFGVARTSVSSDTCRGMYNDGFLCPVCHGRLSYEYYTMSHVGRFSCPSCGHGSFDISYQVSCIDLDNKYIVVNGNRTVSLALASCYNVYNILAAYTACVEAGGDPDVTAKALSGHILRNGRVVTFKNGNGRGMLLVSKHENSVSYNQSIEYVSRQKGEKTVLFIVDAISRKYFTGETSWLYDIDFGSLKADRIILSGKYCYDLKERFSFTDIPDETVTVEPDIEKAVRLTSDGYTYVITCFSDMAKYLSRVEVDK